MIIDTLAQFASKTALSTAGTGLAVVGSNIDLGPVPPGGSALNRDIGNGKAVWLVISVDTAVTSAGAATVSFNLSSDAQDPLAADGSATVHFSTPAIPKATLVAGYMSAYPIPLGNPAYERYLGILQNVGTAALTAGKINAFLTFDPPGGTLGAPNYNDAVN